MHGTPHLQITLSLRGQGRKLSLALRLETIANQQRHQEVTCPGKEIV